MDSKLENLGGHGSQKLNIVWKRIASSLVTLGKLVGPL